MRATGFSISSQNRPIQHPFAVRPSHEFGGLGVTALGNAVEPIVLLALGDAAFRSPLVLTRASSGTFFNSAGVLTTAANDVARFDFNPATLQPRGLLREGSRTNTVRNGEGTGGSGSTPPTNWTGSVTVTGINITPIGPATRRGASGYIYEVAGTSTGGSGVGITPELANGIAAASGQTWSSGMFVALESGSFAGTTAFRLRLEGTNGSTRTELLTPSTDMSAVTSSAVRFTNTATLANVSTTHARPLIEVAWNTGQTINFRFFMGTCTCEQAAFASSPIRTTGTTATRAADAVTMTGAVFASNFAGVGTACTVFAEWEPLDIVAPSRIVNISAALDTNRLTLRQSSGTNQGVNNVESGGVVQATLLSGTLVVNAVNKSAARFVAGDFGGSTNGSAVVTGTGIIPTGLDRLTLGADSGNLNGLFGWMRRVSFYPQDLSNANLQALTA